MTDHITGNSGIISLFTPTSNYVVLADGSHTPIQDIGTTTTTTPTILLLFVFYLPHFSFNLLSISKEYKDFKLYSNIFLTDCVFQELETGKRLVQDVSGTDCMS